MPEIVHVCRPGDTLTRIAATYYGDVRRWPELQSFNKLDNADKLRVGQPLRIPNPVIGAGANSIAQNPAKLSLVPTTKPGPIAHLLDQRAPVKDQIKEAPAIPQGRKEPQPKTGAQFRKLLEAGKFSIDMLGKTFDGMDKYIEILIAVFHLEERDLKGGRAALLKGKDFVDGLVEGFECFLALQEGEPGQATIHAFMASGLFWEFVPKTRRHLVLERLRRFLRATAVTASLASILEVVDRLNAVGCLTKTIAAPFLKKDRWEKFSDGSKELIDAFKEKPAVALSAVLPLAEFLLRLLPKHLAEKLAFRSMARKVSGVGTALVLIFDVVDIIEDPTSDKAWVGLASTGAGLVPGVGTAASAVLDLAGLCLEVRKSIHELAETTHTGVLEELIPYLKQFKKKD